MKNIDLINQLTTLPLDMEVCVLDINKNEADGSEHTSVGVFKEFSVHVIMDDEQLKELQEEIPLARNFIAIEFSDDNDDGIEELMRKLTIAKDILENVKLHFESELHDLHDGVWRDSEESILENTINFLTK